MNTNTTNNNDIILILIMVIISSHQIHQKNIHKMTNSGILEFNLLKSYLFQGFSIYIRS